MRKILYFIVFALTSFSCNLNNEDPLAQKKSEYEDQLFEITENFNKAVLSDPGKIATYFTNKGFEQIPCEEKTYLITKNFETAGIETLAFFEENSEILGFIIVQLEPVSAQHYCFYRGVGEKTSGENQALVKWYQHEDIINCIRSFKYKKMLYSAGFSVPIKE